MMATNSKEYERAYYAANVKKKRAQSRAYYAAHKDEIAPRHAAYRENNKEKLREYFKQRVSVKAKETEKSDPSKALAHLKHNDPMKLWINKRKK